MITWAAIFLVGAIIQTTTFYSLPQFLVGRLIAGLGEFTS
jgi:hypothetical protein